MPRNRPRERRVRRALSATVAGGDPDRTGSPPEGPVSAGSAVAGSAAIGGTYPTDGPRPRDCGVLESGEGWFRPPSSGPNSVISEALPPQGVCSSATRV